MQITVDELNELLDKAFEKGKQSVIKETTVDWNSLLIDSIPNNYIPDACKNCPNHPSNGGSGICHCILGTEITY